MFPFFCSDALDVAFAPLFPLVISRQFLPVLRLSHHFDGEDAQLLGKLP